MWFPGAGHAKTNLTTTTVQAAGQNWTAAIWKTNGTGTAVSPVAGNTYQTVFNGTSIGNGASSTRIRNPASTGLQTFPGDWLKMDTNTELRAKQPGTILSFPGVNGNPGLILNGGMLNGGDDTTFPITGTVQVVSQSYISHGVNGGGGGISPNRAFNFTGVLSGAGNMVILNAGTTVPQQVSGNFNSFSGQWIVQCGWLQGSGANSLGTNSIMVDPLYNGYLAAMPNFQAANGGSWFEPNYDLNSAGKLTLTNGGVMILHQNCVFSAVKIEGVSLSAGTHYYTELAASFPSSFANGGSGSITVQPYGTTPPVAPSIISQPGSLSANVGSPAQLAASAFGTAPLSYQWQKGTNGVYVNSSDTGDVSGSRTNVLNFSDLAVSDAADYRLIVTNSAGAATSQVATVTVVVPDANHPTVAALSPPAGSTVSNLTQIQVTFTKTVVGIDAGDLLINGTPASAVSGSASNYVFSFSQPVAGTVLVFWDIDTAITDLLGNPLDISGSWTYTLTDTTPPTLASTAPAAAATVSRLTQARVVFSKPVSGVVASALLVNGTPATDLSGSGSGPYSFQFPQPAQGIVTFSWAPGQNISDTSANSNRFGGAGWTVTLDTATALAALTNIVINEFLASNQSTNGLRDEDFVLSDWIELYNRGSVAVNLTGWSLTDDATQPALWVFPATNLAAGQYLVVFASANDRRVPGANLHTSFKLTSVGTYLGLYNANFPPQVAHEYSPAYPQQFPDISYGLDAAAGPRYFAIQTPGGPNSPSTLTGAVASVHLSVSHGFFNQPFNLAMTTTTPGATIIYATNGSVPSISGGVTNGTLYSGPVPISRTTALRAAGFAPNQLPSPVESQTYLFVEDIIRQPNNPAGYPTGNVWTATPGIIQNGSQSYYQMNAAVVNDPQYTNVVRAGLISIPTVSLVLPIPDLFDPLTGIYTHSLDHNWERACSMELIFPDGSKDATLDCGLQIQGGTQRDPAKNAKHSVRVQFKGDYGSSTLDLKMYPDSPVTSFKTLVFKAGINLWWHYVGGSNPTDQRYRAQCVRDQFTSDLLLALGWPSFHGQFYHLYLNGLYWGLHYAIERPDEDFAASYLGGASSDYDVLKNTTMGTQIVAGDSDAWNAALALANAGLTNNAQYAQIGQYVDVENLIDYMIVNHWVGNVDWPQHNWYVIRNRNRPDGFKFIVWDAEHVLKDANQNVTTANASGSPAQIYNALRNNAEFRLRFADHLQKLFFNGGLFYADPNPTNALWNPAHPERNIPASYYMRRIAEITNAIVDESARWGGYYGLVTTNTATNYSRNDQWVKELNNLLGFTNTAGNTSNYFPKRSATVLSQYKSIGLFPSVSAPVFNSPGGNVPVGFSLTMTNPNAGGTIYYTTNGSDPRVYGSGAVLPGALVYANSAAVTLKASTVVKARVLNVSWSALSEGNFNVALLGVPIRITELMYNPIGGDVYQFLELQNIGATPVDMGGFSMDGVTYVFPTGTILAPGGVLVLAPNDNPSAFASRYPGVVVSGYYGGHLAHSGERIALLDQNGNTIIGVNYKNSGGWPTAANGGGYSLEIINPNGDPDDPANWRASDAVNGSPGIVNVVTAANGVQFNEIMAENADAVTNGSSTTSDWLELYNSSANSISLSNWSLSNSGNARKYVFPSGTSIPGGGYLVIWCDTKTSDPGLHSGFTLGRKGENLFLYDALTNRVDAFSFGLQLTNYSLGRVGPAAIWQLTLPTPGTANVAANTGGATNLVINEWLANSPTGGSDWLELYNRSTNQPVALAGLYLATSNELFEARSLSFIPPLGYVQLFADKTAGFDHLDFKLTAAGDAIGLYDYSGQQIDRVSFVNQIDSVSQGRLPDGSSSVVSFPGTASPGAPNYVSTYGGPYLNELMARNASAVYDARGNTPDWLELYNPTATNFSLAGMGLTTDLTTPMQWTFPAGVAIATKGYAVVWCDSSRPASTNGMTDLNTGFNLSSDGATVYLFNTNGQIADSVAFGPQIADLSIGRNGGVWNLLASPTLGAANATNAALGNPANLRVNEWMADPGAGKDDWFELYNTDSLPVDLTGLYLSDDPSVTGMTKFLVPALSFIAGHGWVQYIADSHPSHGPNHVSFSLNEDGETIRIYATDKTLIDAVDFGLQATDVSQGRLPDGGTNIVSFASTPTPGDSNYLPLQNVLVNEVLSHSDPPLEDAIELYNPGSADVAIAGWFISNAETDLKKYRIPPGTVLPAGGYKVFYEYQFNSTNSTPFTLNSAHGDSVLVSEADGAGNLSGYRAQVSFGAAQNGVSLGRFPTSAGVDFVALSSRTFGVDNPVTLTQFRTGNGLTNSYPMVGPVVINEIMYYPITGSGTNAFENTDEEYVELFNITPNSVPLYDPAAATNHWKLSGTVDCLFPAGVSLPAGGYALVVGFDPATNAAALANFRTKYGVAASTPIYGPYSGHLDNSGGNLKLYRPDSPQTAPHPDAGFVPYVLVEGITYSNAPPWPSDAAGSGKSLQRRTLGSYGNEPLNWVACSPNPGTRNCVNDTDGDGLPDDWELANGLNPYSAAGNDGANGDPDGDGFTNLHEYLAGTDPHDPQSLLKIDSISLSPGLAVLGFTRVAGHSYSVQYCDGVTGGAWQKLADVDAASATATVQVNDPTVAGTAPRFYRLVTPKLP